MRPPQRTVQARSTNVAAGCGCGCPCRLIDARGELAVLALLRAEGAAGFLDLSACGFDALPSIVWELPGRTSALQELHLANNRLHTLPDVSFISQPLHPQHAMLLRMLCESSFSV